MASATTAVGTTTSVGLRSRARELAGGLRPRRQPQLSPAALIVATRQRLWQRHGADGVHEIERAVGELVSAMATRGISGTLVYLDDSPVLGRLGVLPPSGRDAGSAARTLRSLAERLAWLEEDARYVLLLGGDDVVPFHRLDNPSPDADEVVLSDHPYGSDPAMPLRPVRAVGRMPDPTTAALVTALRSAAAAHRRLAARQSPLLAAAAFGYSASVWKRAARGVFEAVGDPRSLRLSPPLSDRECPPLGADGPRFRYYNLHGMPDAPEWYGQRDPSLPADYPFFPVALRPADAVAPGAVVVSEACHGADPSGGQVDGSVALSCMAGGVLAFVGATGVAYGGLDGPLVAADLLAHELLAGIRSGLPAGDALALAKWTLVREAIRRQGLVDSEDVKAVHNFVLFGDPSLVHAVPSVWAARAAAQPLRGAVEGAGSAESVGTAPTQPLSHAVHACPPDGLVDAVRRAVARRLPELACADADVCLAPSCAWTGAASKAEAAGGAFVVTLSKTLPAVEGRSCRELARVTVDGAGRIRKLTVSR